MRFSVTKSSQPPDPSMPRDIREPLLDILEAISDLENFTEGRSLEDFRQNRLLQAAVERKFEIIGEALTRVRALDPDLMVRITDANRIIGMRNIIAHGYDVIDADIMWSALRDHLPALRSEVELLDVEN